MERFAHSRRWFKPAAQVATWLCLSALMLAEPLMPPATVNAELRSLAARSGIAFTGRVAGIQRTNDIVDVTFTVEESLVGVIPATYTLREWSGLWPLGQSRYVIGQRVAIFIHAPGPSGLSSPVDGMDGVIPVVQQAADQPAMLDVRRLATRVQRSVGSPIVDERNGAMLLTDARALIVGRRPFEPVRHPLPVGVVEPRVPFLLEAPRSDMRLSGLIR